MGFDTRIVPNLLPEHGWVRDTPFPQGVVIIERLTMFLVYPGHEIVDLGCLQRRGPPQLPGLGRHRLVDVWHRAQCAIERQTIEIGQW